MITNVVMMTVSPKYMLGFGFVGLMLYIDGLLYTLISYLFRIFNILATNQLLTSDIYQIIADRIYLYVGIIALFMFTFSLLKALVNPDEVNKGVIKSFQSVITSILLIVLMPSIFQYAYVLQDAIIEDGTITKIFEIDLKNTSADLNNVRTVDEICDYGNKEETRRARFFCQSNYVIMGVFESFFTVEDEEQVKNVITDNMLVDKAMDIVSKVIKGNKLLQQFDINTEASWKKAREYIIRSGNFTYINTFIMSVYDPLPGSGIHYTFIISTVAGIFMAYVILSFCLDLGVRSAKLVFYQLISPIPILSRILTGKEEVFNKWVRSTISCYLEVIIRLLVISFVFFLCDNLFIMLASVIHQTRGIYFLARGIIVLGLLTFAKQAPELLKNALGLSGELKLGIKGKLTDVPILGKAFGAAYNMADTGKRAVLGVGKKAVGAGTGAIGGAYNAAVNKQGALNGAKIGARNGFKAGGMQARKQFQGVYEAFGGKGDAGLFGGRALIDRLTDDADKAAHKSFQEQFRKTAEYQQKYSEEMARRQAEAPDKIATAQAAYDRAYDASKFIDESLKKFKGTDLYQGLMKGSYAQERLKKMVESGQVNANNKEAVRSVLETFVNSQIRQKISEGRGSEAEKQYVQNLNNLEAAKQSLSRAQTDLAEAKNSTAATVVQAAVDELYRKADDKDLSPGGKSYKKEVETIHQKEYRKAHADDIFLHAEAYKELLKDDSAKAPKIPSAPSASSSSSSNSDKK